MGYILDECRRSLVMIKEQERKKTTLPIVLGWLGLLGLVVLALGIIRATLWSFEFPQGLGLIKPALVLMPVACLFGFIYSRCGLGSIALSENDEWGKSKIIVYWLGVGLILGVFMIVWPRLLEQSLDFRFEASDAVGALVGGLVFGGVFARRSMKSRDQPQHGSS